MPELSQQVFGIVLGNILTIATFLVLYANYLLFLPYLESFVWAILLSLALRGPKDSLISWIRYLEDETRDGRTLVTTLLQTISSFLNLSLQGLALFATLVCGILGSTEPPWNYIFFLITMVIGLLLFFLSILNKKIFLYRRFLDDHTMVTIILMGTIFSVGFSVAAFFLVQCINEGIQAVSLTTAYIETNVNISSIIASKDEAMGYHVDYAKDLLATYIDESERLKVEPVMNELGLNYSEWGQSAEQVVNVVYAFKEGGLEAVKEIFIPIPPHGETASDSDQSWLDFFHVIYTFISTVDLSTATKYVSTLFEAVFGTGTRFMGRIIQAISIAIGHGLEFFFKIVILLSVLYYSLAAEQSVIEILSEIVPLPPSARKDLLKTLRSTTQSVFLMPVKMSLGIGTVTLLLFMLLGVPFLYFATFLSCLLAWIPIVPPYMVSIPWAAGLLLSREHWVWSLLLIVGHFLLCNAVEGFIFEKQAESSKMPAWLTPLSVALGTSVFGLQGLLLGPLLVCFVLILAETTLLYLKVSMTSEPVAATGIAYTRDQTLQDE